MAEGLLYLMNRGIVFLCLKNPKEGLRKTWSGWSDRATIYAAGVPGVMVKALVESFIEAHGMEEKIVKALENPNSFSLPYPDIVELDIAKIGGIWGRLKDVIVKVGVQQAPDTKTTYWLEARNNDETWPTLLATLKFYDEGLHFRDDYLAGVVDANAFVANWIKENNESDIDSMSEAKRTLMTRECEEYVAQALGDSGYTTEKIRAQLRSDLCRYKDCVSPEILEQMLGALGAK